MITEKNADEKLPPASLTKLMTSYVLSYELAEGNVANTDMVTISENAWAQNPTFAGSSLMWIEVGKQVNLNENEKKDLGTKSWPPDSGITVPAASSTPTG